MMLKQLRAYYDANGISALTFHCKHKQACSTGCPGFTSAKESFVGPDYIAGTLPRLLFLSLDSGSSSSDSAMKTLEAVQRRELARDVAALPKGKHWYQTHRLALHLLHPFDATLSIERVSRHFAHVNSAKCCQNNPQRAKADGVLFDNCREFIPDELRILRPDILVTQGKEARKVLEHAFHQIRNGTSAVGAEICEHRIIETAHNHQTIWIATHHPRYGKFWTQCRNCWDSYSKAVVTFMKERTRNT
jgi:hypothetical protein